MKKMGLMKGIWDFGINSKICIISIVEINNINVKKKTRSSPEITIAIIAKNEEKNIGGIGGGYTLLLFLPPTLILSPCSSI